MLEINVSGQKRNAIGKKAAKEVRKEGLVPCNIYGIEKDADNRPVATSFTIPFSELRKVVYTPNVYVVNINIDGTEKKVTVGIPVKLVGHAAGVRNGGRLSLSIRQIKVTAPYTRIPEILEIDVTALEIGKSIKVGELNFEGLEFATPKEVVVCSVQMTRQARAAAIAAAK